MFVEEFDKFSKKHNGLMENFSRGYYKSNERPEDIFVRESNNFSGKLVNITGGKNTGGISNLGNPSKKNNMDGSATRKAGASIKPSSI